MSSPALRATSHMLKAREYADLMEQQKHVGLSSISVALAQDAAEQALRAILYVRGITRQGDHRPDEKAREHQALLKDLWPDLEPQLVEYAWLWKYRNQARYQHVDAPPIAEPEIIHQDVERAASCVRVLIAIAERIVRT